MSTLHLTVLADDGALLSPEPTQAEEYRWSHNYAAYRVTFVYWWDDASYIRYQSEDHYSED